MPRLAAGVQVDRLDDLRRGPLERHMRGAAGDGEFEPQPGRRHRDGPGAIRRDRVLALKVVDEFVAAVGQFAEHVARAALGGVEQVRDRVLECLRAERLVDLTHPALGRAQARDLRFDVAHVLSRDA